MKSKLSFAFDFVFGTCFVFLMCFVWARYFIHSLLLSVLICAVITFCIVTLYYLITSKKQKKVASNKTEIKNAHNISTFFLLCTKQEVLKEFCKVLGQTSQTKIKSDFLIVNNVAIRPVYASTEITDKDVLDSFAKIKNTSINKIVVCCQSCSPKAREIASIIKQKKVVILTEFETYKNIFKPANYTVTLPAEEPKTGIRQKLKKYAEIAFNKQRTKNYLLVAIFMLFGSFVLRYNVYYLIFATISTVLALYSHFNTKFNNQNGSTIFN